ncbi:hypothetical protein [Novosphingobium mangrovi (ex Hu et al. 2023)]|uniref:Uncharacterized protein n=1 Tax=Novosphingobium mangrovi (ex Hu et al. 2023) TaxID=2930094 RepID=A0ABT0AGS4_9SPHN|nr:hypothetical protein [Novosphingobium mangrovi (ex Hu et al. 2023)]MCJ1962385.1 hypothetical protein [Novosphingobium mangrovi (ex Hu et al. 2023)]
MSVTEASRDTGAETDFVSAEDDFIFADSDNISLFPEQVVDNLMHVVVALGAEMWTMRRRLMVTEKVLEKVGVSSADIEQYQPSEEDLAAWAEERDIFIKRTFGALERRGGANVKQMDFSRNM